MIVNDTIIYISSDTPKIIYKVKRRTCTTCYKLSTAKCDTIQLLPEAETLHTVKNLINNVRYVIIVLLEIDSNSQFIKIFRIKTHASFIPSHVRIAKPPGVGLKTYCWLSAGFCSLVDLCLFDTFLNSNFNFILERQGIYCQLYLP